MSAPNSNVEYRDIKGFLGYRVGSDGSVWSCWRLGKNSVILPTWRKLKWVLQKDKRYRVHLYRNKKMYYKWVHILVLETFVGSRPLGMEGCHSPDKNPSNNSVSNLIWGTKKTNYAHRIIHGTDNSGSKHGAAKLTEEKVITMRKMYETGNYSHSRLAELFRVSEPTIWKIVNRRAWRHI